MQWRRPSRELGTEAGALLESDGSGPPVEEASTPENMPLLGSTIRALREELGALVREAPTTGLRFQVSSVEVDLELAVGTSAEGGGGVEFYVVSADARGKLERMRTQRLHVALVPTMDGSRIEVAALVSERPNQPASGAERSG